MLLFPFSAVNFPSNSLINAVKYDRLATFAQARGLQQLQLLVVKHNYLIAVV